MSQSSDIIHSSENETYGFLSLPPAGLDSGEASDDSCKLFPSRQ